LEDVAEAHEEGEAGGQGSVEDADEHIECGSDEADEEGDAGPLANAREEIAAEFVGAKPELERGGAVFEFELNVGGVGAKKGKEEKKGEKG
jgi:hypothetical protein